MQPLSKISPVQKNIKMKKKYWQLALMPLFLIAAGFVVIKYQSDKRDRQNTAYTLLPRKGNCNIAEWQQAKHNVDKLLARLKAMPGDTKTELALANAYIMEARISGNVAYYDQAALRTVDNIISREPSNYEALMLRSLLQLSQHHFAEGLETAELAVKIDSNSAFVWGLLVDAHVEMGNYEDAVEAAGKMISIRPDLRSYSRIAYLREIHGDYPGAVDAMTRAVAAGIAAEESTEWCRVQLGRLYENMGEIGKACFQYQLSLAARPDYPYALAGMARIADHEKKYDSSVYYYRVATDHINGLGMSAYLAAAYQKAGQSEKAKTLYNEIGKEINEIAKASSQDPDMGHYSDKELAHYYVQHKDYDKALAHAISEYKRRPKNIEVNELVGWIYYKRNETGNAVSYIKNAFVTNSKSPALLCTAGLIYFRMGEKEKAKTMLGLGLKNDPVLFDNLKMEAAEVFAKL
jgi:tetratricopeptide (TPR) repeat protein